METSCVADQYSCWLRNWIQRLSVFFTVLSVLAEHSECCAMQRTALSAGTVSLQQIVDGQPSIRHLGTTPSSKRPWGSHLTGAIFLVMVEGRTLRPADNDRFTLQYKTNSRKGSPKTVAICSNKPDSSLRPVFRGRQCSGTVRTPNSFRELFRFSSRHCA